MLPRPAPVDLVVDTSAIMAVVLGEQFSRNVEHALIGASGPVISAATLVELGIVAAARSGPAGLEAARAVLDTVNVVTMPVIEPIAELAVEAWQRFGRGRHSAGLNFGDCFTYATAMHFDAAILCVGSDFPRTDARLVDLS